MFSLPVHLDEDLTEDGVWLSYRSYLWKRECSQPHFMLFIFEDIHKVRKSINYVPQPTNFLVIFVGVTRSLPLTYLFDVMYVCYLIIS